MKKIHAYIVKKSCAIMLAASLVTFSILSGCSDNFLTFLPEQDMTEGDAFQTPQRIAAQVSGLYASAKVGQLFGGRYYIYNDIRGEEFRNRGTNVVTGFTTFLFTNDPADTHIANFWRHGYLTINRINKFLQDFDEHSGIVSSEQERIYRAEAKFLRALCYHGLVQLFAKPYTMDQGASRGLPLRLQAETTNANNELAPSTVAEIYAQILQDLEDAEADLAEDNGSANNNTTRAHKNTAIALKVRVLLAMGRHAEVITEGNKIVSAAAPFSSTNRVPHALQADVSSVFTAYSTLENIFSFPMADTNPPGQQNQLGFYYNAGNIEYYLNHTNPGIFANTAAWPETDARRLQLTTVNTMAGQSRSLLTKWSGVTPFVDWVPVMRYAEVLLNLAEAEAEVGNLTRSISLLEAVRHRSDPDYTFSGLNTGADVIKALLLERRIELLGEGFRIPDLQRRSEPIISYGAGVNNPIPVTDSRYTFPIPTPEVLTNSDL